MLRANTPVAHYTKLVDHIIEKYKSILLITNMQLNANINSCKLTL